MVVTTCSALITLTNTEKGEITPEGDIQQTCPALSSEFTIAARRFAKKEAKKAVTAAKKAEAAEARKVEAAAKKIEAATKKSEVAAQKSPKKKTLKEEAAIKKNGRKGSQKWRNQN